MTIYLPKAALADPAHAAERGVNFVEYIGSNAIGAQGKNATDLDFMWSLDALRERIERVGEDTNLLVMDVLDGPRQVAIKQGDRRVMHFIGAVLHSANLLTDVPIAFDGLPGRVRGWNDDVLNVCRQIAGVDTVGAATCYWGDRRTFSQHKQDLEETCNYHKNEFDYPSSFWLTSLDPTCNLWSATDAQHRELFAHAKSLGISRVAMWYNHGANPPIAREVIDSICDAWEKT